MLVRLVANYDLSRIFNLTPGKNGRWADIQFCIDPAIRKADYLIVLRQNRFYGGANGRLRVVGGDQHSESRGAEVSLHVRRSSRQPSRVSPAMIAAPAMGVLRLRACLRSFEPLCLLGPT
mgnify:CR=1 FL=1